MAKNVVIRDNTYNSVPYVEIPQVGGGKAEFYDVSGANAAAADVRNGKKFFGASGEATGAMTEKAAATISPSTSQQKINAGQYLAGDQTIEAVTTTGLQASNIVAGVTVKVGTASDDDRIANVTGTAQIPVISQDSTTKVLSIS
jgi:hypothetical protein